MTFPPQPPTGNSNPPQPDRTPRLIALTVGLVLGLSALLIASVYLLGWKPREPLVAPTAVSQVTAQPTILATPTTSGRVTVTPVASPSAVVVELTPSPNTTISAGAEAALRLLDDTEVPQRDLYSIAARLKLKSTTPIPHTTGNPAGNYQSGHSDTFYISNIKEHTYYTITATIQMVTDHVYWYAQDGKRVDMTALQEAARTFDDEIYPNNQSLFGSEWLPGVDNDPHLTVIFADIPNVGGYYSSADEYTRAINPFSNEREIIYINTGRSWAGIESTLAHEYQHMIHWNEHSNHDIWLNEGMSVLSSALNGYENVGVDYDFMTDPDVQLNAWAASPNEAVSHYGAAFLFLDFIRSHHGGKDVLRDIVSAPRSGTGAIDDALAKLGKKERFNDVFEQWAVANLVDGREAAAKAGLDYPDREVDISPHVKTDRYPRQYTGSVSQYGADYVELAGTGALNVHFTGQAETGAIGTKAHSGTSLWWSNRGDVSNMNMTRAFDLRTLQSATLSFFTWYDIENTFDFAYVEVSTDGGATWDSLKGKYTTTDNPNGTNQGNGYTGESKSLSEADKDGWVKESLDLSPYAGKEVLVRFEYITDDGYNAQGFAVDDIAIPELGFSDAAESDNGWQSAGFVRIHHTLPQHYYLAAVKLKADGDGFDIQPVEVGPSGDVSFTIEGLGTTYDRAVLIIAGETPYTLLKANYTLDINQ